MTGAVLAVPGDLDTPTGGYGYARRLLAEAQDAGWDLCQLPLPGGFPDPTADALGETLRRLAEVPRDTPLIVDGLAYGVLPAAALRELTAPLVALCHHPLALETGLADDVAARLAESEREALAEAKVVIATSEATAEGLRRDYGVSSVVVARPGTDPAPRAAGSGGSEVHILSVGSLVPRKGHDRLLGALARLPHTGWHCRIVGPFDRDAGETARIRRLVDELDLSGRVELVGPLDEHALAAAYHGADIFALASRYEGFGMVFAEAVARGLPVLGPRLASVEEATAGGALLVPPGDEDGFERALNRLVSDPSERARWADRATEAAERLTRWPDTLAAARQAADLAVEAAR